MGRKQKNIRRTIFFYVLIGCMLTGLLLPVGIPTLQAQAATICPVEPAYERVSKGSVTYGNYVCVNEDGTGMHIITDLDAYFSYPPGGYYETSFGELYVSGEWYRQQGCPTSGETVSSLPWEVIGVERCVYQSSKCELCGTKIANVYYVDLSDFDYYKITIGVSNYTYTVGSVSTYTKEEFLSDLYRKYNVKYYEEESTPYTTVHNWPANDTHECTDKCKEAPAHTHKKILDETVYTYTCDCTTTNRYVYTNYYVSASDSKCGHQVQVHHSVYECRQCGLQVYEEYKNGCSATYCSNYYATNEEYDYQTHPGTHTYQKKGIRYECNNTSSFNSGKNYRDGADKYIDYNVVCTLCGTTFYHQSDGYVDTMVGKAKHYYYVQETTEESCYYRDMNNIHSASSLIQEKKNKSYNCGSKTHADYTIIYSCNRCGEAYKYKDYFAACTSCGYSSMTDEGGLSPGHTIGQIEYSYRTSATASYDECKDINDRVLHTTEVLTCTTSDAYGDYICDKVVLSLYPVEKTQTVEYGESINTQAYARFLNGKIEIVTCQISYDPTLINQEQTAILSYGEYSSTASKDPRTAEITIHLVRHDADVTLEVYPAEAGSAIGTGTYTIGSDVSVSVNASPGYAFIGWYEGDTLKSTDIDYTFTMPEESFTLIAKFTPKVYTLHVYSEFPSMGSVTAPASAAYKSSVTVTATPANGFTFYGWYDGATLVSKDVTYTFTMPYYPYELMARFSASSHTVSFDSKGGSTCESIQVQYLGTYGSLPIPTKAGYVFQGWTYNGEYITETTPVTIRADHTLTAVWEVAGPEFILVYFGDPYGENSWSTDRANMGQLGLTEDTFRLWLPEPVKRGYSFTGWYRTENSKGNGDTLGDSNNLVTRHVVMKSILRHTLHAGWQEKSYVLSFDSNGGSRCNDMTITYDRRYGYHSTLPIPTKQGFTFAGWYVSELDNNGVGTQIENETRVQAVSDQTLYAKWTKNAMNITVKFDARTKEQVGLTVTESAMLGYGSTIGQIVSGVSSVDITYPGVYGGYPILWCRCEDTEAHSAENGWKEYGNQHYYVDFTVASTYDFPTVRRRGYDFNYWELINSVKITPTTETQLAQNHTIYAHYTPKTYTITFDSQGATSTNHTKSVTVTFDAPCPSITVPTKPGYTFAGYYTESDGGGTQYYNKDGQSENIWTESEDKTLYAKWEARIYTVTFDWNFNYNATAYEPKTNWEGNTKQVQLETAYGALPRPERLGYTFVGWYEAETDNNGIGTEVTETTILQRAENHTLYAKWKANIYTVILDQRGALIPGQTSFEIEFDAPLTDLTGAMPQKRGYTFHGYCSDTHGNGTPYFDETGTAILYAPAANPSNRFNAQNFVTILYAYWTQDEVEKPEAGDRDEPNEEDWTTDEDDAFEEEVTRVPANILIYADDYNAETGANTDKQPYLVQDSIPSTEQVAIRAKMDAWLLSYRILRHAGIEYVPYTVTVTYQTQHEIAEEELVVSEVQTSTKTYLIPKTWAYYALESFGLYKPAEVTVTNAAFVDSVTMSVTEDVQTPYPAVERTIYGEKEEHMVWPSVSFTKEMEQIGTVSYTTGTNANGPYVSVVLPEQYLISDVIGSLPDVGGILDILCGNAAWEDTTTYTAWSDKLTWDGTVVLDDTKLPISGAEYNEGILPKAEDNAPDTWYRQTYRSGIQLKETIANGTYASYASIRYRGDVNNVESTEEIILYSATMEGQNTEDFNANEQNIAISNAELKNIEIHSAEGQDAEVLNTLIPIAERDYARTSRAIYVNPIVIHTPVVCDGIIDTETTGTMCTATDTVELTLKEDLNFFRLKVSNYGTHKLMLGYGEKDFLYALSGKTHVAQENGTGTVYNQVQFPFGVFVDVGADSYIEDGVYNTTGDYYIEAGTWLTVGEDEIVFYVPVTLQEDTYTVNFRSISANCPTNEQGQFVLQSGARGNMQRGANTTLSSYVAYDTIELTIRGCMNQFEIIGTSDEEAQKQVEAGSQMLTLKKGNWFNYKFSTRGSFLSDAASVTITPTYYWIPEDSQVRVETDLYYTESINGMMSYYVQVGSDKDATNIHTVTNHDTSLAIAKRLLDNTARILADTMFVGQVGECYTFTNVELNRYMRMLGVLDTTQLPTKYCQACYVAYRDNETPACTHMLASTGIKERAERIKQEWYGQIYLPAYCYVIPKGTKSGYCSYCNKTCYVTGSVAECEQCHSSLEDLQLFDFALYSSMQTLTGKEEFFQTKGTILVAFDIVAVNDSGEEVRYTAWSETELAKQWKNSNIPYKEGDVIRYYAGKKFGDDYEVGGVE